MLTLVSDAPGPRASVLDRAAATTATHSVGVSPSTPPTLLTPRPTSRQRWCAALRGAHVELGKVLALRLRLPRCERAAQLPAWVGMSRTAYSSSSARTRPQAAARDACMVKGGAIGGFGPAAADAAQHLLLGLQAARGAPSRGQGSSQGSSPTRADGASGKPYASRGASGAVGVLTLLRCAPQRRRVRVGARWARRALRRGVGLPLERAAPPSGHVLPPLLRERGHAPAQAPRVRSEDAEGAEEQIQARTRGEHQAEGTRQWAASHARAAGGIDAPAR